MARDHLVLTLDLLRSSFGQAHESAMGVFIIL